MAFLTLFTCLALTISAASARKCQNITVPVSISARNGIFNLEAPASNIDATNFILNETQQGHNFTQELLTGVGLLPQLLS